eukprot:Pompholyxophrys_punicea_v1_NODE_71_length_3757_cov_5.265460.p1 type:complete len:393 gc:universal NODE_71_length_3757_cov_5.265460:130-1308(+)
MDLNEFKKTTEPTVCKHPDGKFYLRLRKYLRKGEKGQLKSSKHFSTKQEALDFAPSFRNFHEFGDEKGSDHKPLQDTTHLAFYTRHIVEEQAFKRYKSEFDVTNFWEYKEKVWRAGNLSQRYIRCLNRAWKARAKNKPANFDGLAYLKNLNTSLTSDIQDYDLKVDRLREAVRTGKLNSLLIVDEDEILDVSDLSAHQIGKLYSQAMSTTAFLEFVRERCQKILVLTEEGINSSNCRSDVEEVMENIKVIRFDDSKPEIASRVSFLFNVSVEKIEWQRIFMKLGGFYESRQGRAVRGWILNEDDLLLRLQTFLKTTKDISVIKACKFVNTELFVGEGLEALLLRYKLSLPVVPSTVHSWMIRAHAGAKFDKVVKSYYTDGHERAVRAVLRLW